MKLGFIGLGIMGAPMAGHLLAAGHELFAQSHGGVPAELQEQGAKVCADAREVAGLALVHKADRYFHGGVEIDYCDRGRPAEAGSAPAGSAAERDDHVDHEREARPVARDPWSWVNARVHVQDHRHLAGREVDEMIPWVWAACRADPTRC